MIPNRYICKGIMRKKITNDARNFGKTEHFCRILCFRTIPPNSFTKKNLGGFSLNCCLTCFQKRRGKALKKSIKSEKPTFWITLLCLLFPFVVFYYFVAPSFCCFPWVQIWNDRKGIRGFETTAINSIWNSGSYAILISYVRSDKSWEFLLS